MTLPLGSWFTGSLRRSNSPLGGGCDRAVPLTPQPHSCQGGASAHTTSRLHAETGCWAWAPVSQPSQSLHNLHDAHTDPPGRRSPISLHCGSQTNNKPSPKGPPAWEAEKGDPGLPAQAARRMTNTTDMPSCDNPPLELPMPACLACWSPESLLVTCHLPSQPEPAGRRCP